MIRSCSPETLVFSFFVGEDILPTHETNLVLEACGTDKEREDLPDPLDLIDSKCANLAETPIEIPIETPIEIPIEKPIEKPIESLYESKVTKLQSLWRSKRVRSQMMCAGLFSQSDVELTLNIKRAYDVTKSEWRLTNPFVCVTVCNSQG